MPAQIDTRTKRPSAALACITTGGRRAVGAGVGWVGEIVARKMFPSPSPAATACRPKCWSPYLSRQSWLRLVSEETHQCNDGKRTWNRPKPTDAARNSRRSVNDSCLPPGRPSPMRSALPGFPTANRSRAQPERSGDAQLSGQRALRRGALTLRFFPEVGKRIAALTARWPVMVRHRSARLSLTAAK